MKTITVYEHPSEFLDSEHAKDGNLIVTRTGLAGENSMPSLKILPDANFQVTFQGEALFYELARRAGITVAP